MFRVMSPQGYLQRPGLRAGVGEIIRPLASHIHILTSPRAWQAAINVDRLRQIAQQIHFPSASLAHLPFTFDQHLLEQALLVTASFKQ
ncbi:hypothetical protein [Pantoea agglomerans]|uniref:hypothetical protein n=1 Tax=Enterobacter agglomerans TaxID=549 RepID=UPI001EFFFCBD|nr:hypothetical protein [Pantoea agglomerans]